MIKVGIVFGGQSCEHEISILSAASVAGAIPADRYEARPIGINRKGEWFLIAGGMEGLSGLDDPRIGTLIPADAAICGGQARHISAGDLPKHIDFAFPVLHGPYGEDGKAQGLFEMLGLPYAGCGVTASAIAMDKIFTKEIWLRAGLPVCAHEPLCEGDYLADPEGELGRLEKAIGFPAFVKPANMGSSVGVSMARDGEGLKRAVEKAFLYDGRLIVEERIDCRELEAGLLGNFGAEVSAVGEIAPAAEFYDYDSKYRDGATRLSIPADIDGGAAARVRALAARAYRALGCEGFARIDFFLERPSGRLLLNEINTIPGFTAYSMFPLLWKEAGLGYPELIERIVGLGYERHNAKNNRGADHAV
ncbi:MAG: D-alanine--D-alanine ligase [Clostridiales Family XIII bacterium]|jgi:D-alanine-D-alanine ligase|nr:D-alanine--D-alanine ligase [Clostridiales Family XIII bacterium]